ncbi:MAG: Zn-dependent hydrolase [Alphaproteobacteria bacterium]|nr:Zn-dependent hydrolase [Alphaproteobacteria bacterium]
MDMAKIGATAKGGSRRLAASDEDRMGRDLFVAWCKAAGLGVTVDRIGNIFARRPGRDPTLPPVVTGSHLDTQPTGGRFDGVYGVLAGLEVIRTLNDSGLVTDAPIEVAVWTNEEGARFAPAMVASGAFAGVFDVDTVLEAKDVDGRTLGAELARIGYAGDQAVGGRPLLATFEAHIEQGPILEAEKKTIGVVTGVQGIRWYDVRLDGMEAHAGPTPMTMRKDAMVAAARMIAAADASAKRHAPHGRATCKVVEVRPQGSRNTIAGHVAMTVDMRHPDATALEALDADLRAAGHQVTAELGVAVAIEAIWTSPPVAFDAACVAAVREATERLGYTHQTMVSGAGHDSCYIARVAPTAMIFVPCEKGISHNEIENAKKEDLAAGCNVLLHAMLARANAAAS